MAKQFYQRIYPDPLSRLTDRLLYVRAPFSGTLTDLTIWQARANDLGQANIFQLSIAGTNQYSGAARPAINSGEVSVSKTGESFAVTKGDIIQINLAQISPLGVPAPIAFQVVIDDGAGAGYTTEELQDLVADMFVAGSHTSWNYNDTTGKLSVDATQLTDEEIQDKVAALLVAGSNVTINYNDGANTLTISSATRSDEEIQDVVAALLTAGSNVTLTYNDAGNTLTIAASGGSSVSIASTTEVLTGTDTAKAVSPDALAALWEQGADIASAGTLVIGEGGYFKITGTTTITDIDPATDKAGRHFILRFSGALTLTHNATTLILPTGANILTVAGDVATFVSEGSDAVRCISYTRADGSALLSSGGSGLSNGKVLALANSAFLN